VEAPVSSIFPSLSEPWQREEGGFEIGLEAETRARGEEEQGTVERRKEERLCATTGPPSWAQNEEARGSRATHVQSTATRRPSRRLLGPAALRTCSFASLLSQVRAHLGPGGYCLAFWERGSPDLPACGLRRGSRGGPAWPIFISTGSRSSRGTKPRGADDRKLPQARPRQASSRGGREIKAGYLTRCP